MPIHVCTHPENVVKIGPLHSEITGLQELRGPFKMKKVTLAELNNPSACDAGRAQ